MNAHKTAGVLDFGEIDDICITQQSGYFHFTNGSFVFCGDYFVPGFTLATASPATLPIPGNYILMKNYNLGFAIVSDE